MTVRIIHCQVARLEIRKLKKAHLNQPTVSLSSPKPKSRMPSSSSNPQNFLFSLLLHNRTILHPLTNFDLHSTPMVQARGSSTSSGRKTTQPRSLRAKLTSKRRPGSSMEPSQPVDDFTGVVTSPSPSYSINPSRFGFLKSLDLQSVGLDREVIPIVNPITGWELVV